MKSKESNIIFYTTPNGQVSVQVQFEDGSFWLTQKRMGELFGVDVRTINEHLQNIYYSKELPKDATIRKIRIVQYDRNSPVTKDFFATVQNKLHWAITGKTAAEIIYSSADSTKLYMGLTNWKHAPEGTIIKSDTLIAKNYLNEAHIKELNRIVSAYLDLAENRATRGIATNMQEWAEFLTQFLELSQYPILQDNGKISALEAKLKAEQEYDIYRKIQDDNYISDFDKEIKRVQGEFE